MYVSVYFLLQRLHLIQSFILTDKHIKDTYAHIKTLLSNSVFELFVL